MDIKLTHNNVDGNWDLGFKLRFWSHEHCMEAVRYITEGEGSSFVPPVPRIEYRDGPVEYRDVPRPSMPQEALDICISALVRRGRKIDAIKLHRTYTGMGLKESKEYCERIQELGPVYLT
jgi:ribosomal protein L7/L12